MDYPRSRGDDWDELIEYLGGYGLSPLARGRPALERGDDVIERTIPARAGTTSRPASRHVRAADYPRSRGDDQHFPLGVNARAGLSPLARGRPTAGAGRAVRSRTIPARAGTTAWVSTQGPRLEDYPRSRGDDVR